MELNCLGEWLCNEVGHLCQIFMPAIVGQLGALHLVRMHLGGGGSAVKPPIHFHCVLHAKRGWVQIACKIACVLNGRPLM